MTFGERDFGEKQTLAKGNLASHTPMYIQNKPPPGTSIPYDSFGVGTQRYPHTLPLFTPVLLGTCSR